MAIPKKPNSKLPKPKGLPKPEDELLPPQPPAEPVEDPNATSGIAKEPAKDEQTVAKDAEDDLNEEIDDNFKLAYDADQEWIKEAEEDIEFRAGKQWSEEDRSALAMQRRPCLTFNKIKPIVQLITGHYLQNSARIQVKPEGGEDEKFSAVSDRLLDYIDEQAQLEFNLGYQFAGTQTTGKTYLELLLDYDKDPIFGELRSIYHGRPGTIFPDPRGTAYDLNEDRQFCFKLIQKSKSQLKDLYPDKAKQIDEIASDSENPNYATPGKEGDRNNYGADKTRSSVGLNTSGSAENYGPDQRQYWVKEYWRFTTTEKWCCYFVDKGDIQKYDSEEEANATAEQRKQQYLAEGGDPAAWTVVIKKRRIKSMKVAVRCGGVLLVDGPSPMEPYYSGFPFFRSVAGWSPESNNAKDSVQGIVRCLKDPQREKNKSRSQFLHIINTAANSGWKMDKGAMDQQEKANLQKFGSTPGIIVEVNDGKNCERIDPVPAPIAQQVREKAASDDFKEVSGVNSDLLAVDQSNNPSGKAIALRIRQAITILEPDFRNFRYTKKILGNCIMKIVPSLFDVPKIEKVLGQQFMKENGVDRTFLQAYLIMISDSKYNVRISEQGDTKTLREETLEDLMQMIQHGTQIPFEVLADFMNMPNKQEVVNKVKEYQAQQMQQMALLAAAGQKPKTNGAAVGV